MPDDAKSIASSVGLIIPTVPTRLMLTAVMMILVVGAIGLAPGRARAQTFPPMPSYSAAESYSASSVGRYSTSSTEQFSVRSDSQELLDAAGRIYGLDPILLRSIAAVESGGNPRAVSPKGAQGLMQLMPATAQRFAVKNAMDPADNVLGAVRFLRFIRQWQTLHPEVGRGMAEMLAAYNAGEGAVAKYHGVPPYPETQEYVRRVMTAYLFGGELPHEFRGLSSSPVRRAHRPVMAARARSTVDSSPSAGTDAMRQLAEIQRSRAAAEKQMVGMGPDD